MTLADLEDDEKLALVALLRFMVRIDGVFSPNEVQALTALSKEIGSAEFWAAMREAQQRIVGAEDLVQVVESVERREVQEWIHATLARMAAIDGLGEAESELLEWVEETWALNA
ncbi:MAG: hypothetical protein H5U40_00045 [Polyangiaceae bacterium]|nr:hypothetical protein [Polyangiaceae bacterium]